LPRVHSADSVGYALGFGFLFGSELQAAGDDAELAAELRASFFGLGETFLE
jgi:hypothetical protein